MQPRFTTEYLQIKRKQYLTLSVPQIQQKINRKIVVIIKDSLKTGKWMEIDITGLSVGKLYYSSA